MDIVQRTSMRSIGTPSLYKGRIQENEDDNVQAVDNRFSVAIYYTPKMRSNITSFEGTESGGYQQCERRRGLGAKREGMLNYNLEYLIYKESLNDVNIEQERPRANMTPISKIGRGLRKTRLEAEDHDLSNVYVKRKHDIGETRKRWNFRRSGTDGSKLRLETLLVGMYVLKNVRGKTCVKREKRMKRK